MWEGAETSTFIPPHHPGQATCIDHLTIWDPKHLADQIEGTTTLTTSFFDHKGVLGTIRIPVGRDTANPLTKTLWVYTFKFIVPKLDIET